jgi:hypothetical protein
MIKKKPLSILSFDKTNNIIVCDYDNKFIDLDDTKGILNKPQSPNSPDMLYIDDKKKEIWFVEFKSSNHKSLNSWKEKSKLRKKLFSALFLVYEIFCDRSCDYRKYDKFYFIVYNKEKIVNFEDEFLSLANEPTQRSIEFGLEDLKPQFIKDVFTEDCTELKKLFKKRFDIEFIKEKNE